MDARAAEEKEALDLYKENLERAWGPMQEWIKHARTEESIKKYKDDAK